MTRTNSKRIFNKLPVFRKHCSFYNSVATINLIIKQRMTDMLHVNAYLVRASCFKFTLNQRYISKSFKHFVVCNRFLAMITVGICIKKFSESFVPANMRPYRS